MAELTRPKYSIPRFNKKSAKGSAVSNPSTPPARGSTHTQKMAQIAMQGIMQLEDAYDNAEAQRIQQEINEEKVLIEKHIGKQESLIDNNIKSVTANFLDPRGMEENYSVDGQTWGEHKLMPYESSSHLSDKAKKRVQPIIDLANNTFSRKTQNKMSGELVARSVKTMKINYKQNLSKFQKGVNIATQEGADVPDTMFKPDSYQPAIDMVNNYEQELREQMKYGGIDEEDLKINVHQMNQDLAGILLNRHLALNPKEAIKQFTSSKHSVNGVTVDPVRIAKFLDTHMRKQYLEDEAEKDSLHLAQWEFKINDDPHAALKELTNDTEENRQILVSSMNGMLEYELDDLGGKIPNFELLEQNPRWTKSKLVKAVLLATKGSDAEIADSERRQLKLFQVKLGADFSAEDGGVIARGRREDNYNYNKGTNTWEPKSEAIGRFSKEYRIPKQTVEATMIAVLSGADLREGSAGIGMKGVDFPAYQNSVLKWWQDHIMFDRELGDASDTTNPLKTIKGQGQYKLLNDFQRNAIDSMVTQLSDLKTLAVNHTEMSLKELNMSYTEFNEKGKGQGNAKKLSNSVWEMMKKQFYEERIENLTYRPISTALRDLNYYNIQVKRESGQEVPDEPSISTIRKNSYDRMVKLGVWITPNDPNKWLPIPEEGWANTLEILGANKKTEQISVE